jgi:hypothetical protein
MQLAPPPYNNSSRLKRTLSAPVWLPRKPILSGSKRKANGLKCASA